MMRKFFIFLLLVPSFLLSADQAYFHPPSEWLISDPTSYAPSVKICFISKKNKGFPPSINLAIEQDIHSLEDYLTTIRSLHLKDSSKKWRRLGPLQAQGIEGVLTEIDTTTSERHFRMLQCIFVHEKTAYILTAAALKNEMPHYYPSFLKAFKSFTISQNLLESIPDPQRKQILQDRLGELKNRRHEMGFEKKVWKPFEKQFVKEFADMGAHWQILVLTEEKQKYEKTNP